MNFPSKLTKNYLPELLRQGILKPLDNSYVDHILTYIDGFVNLSLKTALAAYYNQKELLFLRFLKINACPSMDAVLLAINRTLVSCLKL